jgi:predicted acetyltransferase
VPEYLELQAALTANRTLMEINSASRMAYANLSQQQTLLFFVDGRVYVLSPSNLNVVSTICNLKGSFKKIFLNLKNNDELVYVAMDMLREGSLLLSDPI